MVRNMTEYKSVRLIDGKPRKVIVDENGNIMNRNPSKDKLKYLEKEFYENRQPNRYTNEELLEYLRQFYETKGKIPIEVDFTRGSRFPSYGTYIIRFGSWKNCLQIAGLIGPYIEESLEETMIFGSNEYTNYKTEPVCKICNKKITCKIKDRDKQGNWTGKWICKKCHNIMRKDGHYPSSNMGQIADKKTSKYRQYNSTNICTICRKNILTPGHVYREYNEKGDWTGKWVCRNCRRKDIWKESTHFRNGDLDPFCETGKGYMSQQVTCRVLGIGDMNIKNDNFNTPIDHSKHHLYGNIATKSRLYDRINKSWSFYSGGEHNKDVDNMFSYCLDDNMKNIIKGYIFPKKLITGRQRITINDNINLEYEKYRIKDIKPFNDTYQEILKEIREGKDPIIRKTNI